MIGNLRWLGLGLALLAAQGLIASALPGWARPDLILVFALALGVRRASPTWSLAMAFGFGFCFDALSGSDPGLYALLRGTACALTRALDRALYLRAAMPWSLYASAWGLLDWIGLALVLRLLRPDALPGAVDLLVRVPGAALATGIAAGLLYALLRRVEAAEERDASWTVLTSVGSRR